MAFPRVLFIAHCEEILDQSMRTFRRIRPGSRLGRFDGKDKDAEADVLFASVQTLSRLANLRQFATDAFDYIAMDRDYFGLMVDYASDEFYPGHWPLLFLPLCHGVWRITGDRRYAEEYSWLLERLDLAPGRDPDYLRQNIRCLHRWFYQFGALLESGAEPRSLFLEGLRYQVAAVTEGGSLSSATLYDVPYHAWIWLAPHDDALRGVVLEQLMAQDVGSFLYRWPGYRYGPPLDWRDRAMYCYKTTNWLEMYWKGRWRGDW